ncbi:hypothetical protein Tsubulata_019413 [Turnera subulata]|uniref:Phenolic glucoside malonyltransferase 1-like n=1 Tax=Turnera subulata TaxID=218843 RepID=A0A9Q0JHU8_9ROSI|nr:hypothetical protein Tsubulata_019413 [Turnera subulata]
MASTNPVKVLEVCKVSPYMDSPESPTTESSLPLTFFDLMWLRFHPVERIFFYELTELTHDLFRSTVLPRLKHSLSLTLLHFLPLAGNLTWPSHASKPFLLYTPGDGVALTVAVSDADFRRLSGDHVKGVQESGHYVPELSVTDSAASPIALQITYFPNQGFCIGVSAHHAILDGKSSIMFVKAWANLCKRKGREDLEREHPSLPPELAPCLNRALVQDPEEDLASFYLNDWSKLTQMMQGKDSDPKSLALLPMAPVDPAERVKITVRLSREDIRRIRERVSLDFDKVSKDDHQPKPLHLSTFVIVYAYTLVCIMRAKGLAHNKKVIIGFVADCRARLEPPLPANYFGNCVIFCIAVTQARNIVEEHTSVAFVAKELSGCVTKLEKGVLEAAKRSLSEYAKEGLSEVEAIGVAGSTRLEVYGTDFGWGRPKKVEVTSIDRTGSISMAESGDGSGGVEIGCVLKKHQMQMFCSLFAGGLPC